MKVVVNRDNCIGCGACESIEPSVFQLDDEGISVVMEDSVKDADPEKIDEAVECCPTSAISKDE